MEKMVMSFVNNKNPPPPNESFYLFSSGDPRKNLVPKNA